MQSEFGVPGSEFGVKSELDLRVDSRMRQKTITEAELRFQTIPHSCTLAGTQNPIP
jgi:hypothetical protein